MQINRTFITAKLLILLFVFATLSFRIGSAQKPQDASTYYDQALALISAGKLPEAINALKSAIKLRHDYVDAYYRLAETYTEMEEFKKAADSYKQIVKYTPDSAAAYIKLGTAYSRAGDNTKAIDAYSDAIRLDPKAADAHYKLGSIYVQTDKEKAATEEYKILETLDPKLAQELFNLIYKPTVDVVSDGTVRLRAIAIDSEGVPVKGLTTDDFQVAEESIPQRFAVSLNNDATSIIGLAVDASGSLRSGFPLLVASAKVILNGIKPQDETLLVRFIDRDKIEVMQDFTSDKTILTKAIDSLYVEGGQSAVVDAVYVCAQRVAGYRFPDDSVHRVLLLLTDGEDRASFYSIDQLVALLRKIDVQIFAISFSVDETGKKLNQNQPRKSAELLQRVAAETGGKVYFPKSIPELRTAINEMVGLLSDEYLIQYKPTQPLESGNYRQTAVTLVKRPGRERWGLAVRSGYLFSKKQAPH